MATRSNIRERSSRSSSEVLTKQTLEGSSMTDLNGWKLREWLYQRVIDNQPFIVSVQKHRHPLLDLYFKSATFCGDKLFYITLIPACFWVGDAQLGRLLTLHITFNVYIGNILKEVFALPRPISPPVWRSKVEHDYGLPSSHSMNAMSIALFLTSYLLSHRLIEMAIWVPLAVAAWVFSISFSRMYLGVHSGPDILFGLSLGVLSSMLFINFGEQIDIFVTQHPFIPIVGLLLMVLLVVIHPRTKSPSSPSYGRSISIVGLSVGLIFGSWLQHTRQSPDLFAVFTAPLLKPIIVAISKTSIGQSLSPDVYVIASKMILGFLIINVMFFFMQQTSYMIIRATLGLRFVSITADKIAYSLERFAFPSYPIPEYKKPIAMTPKQSAIMWSKFVSLLLLSIVLADTIPNLYQLIYPL